MLKKQSKHVAAADLKPCVLTEEPRRGKETEKIKLGRKAALSSLRNKAIVFQVISPITIRYPLSYSASTF